MNTTRTAKAYKGLPMEGVIASWYARITRQDLGRHQQMAARLVKHIPAGGRVLEIAPGPGYFCIELARLGDFHITGLDISRSFVDIARQNAAAAGLAVEFRHGDAAHMPFAAESFDFTFCQAAFKNFSQPEQAIAEMHRVLRPGGRAVIADMHRDASPADMEQEVRNMHLKAFDAWMTRWTFENMLVKSAYRLDDIRAMAAGSPFGSVRLDVQGVGFLAWFEKPAR